ncbi:Glycosyltransferase involved in cell wall bisynthesis [Tranquillimonas rosea]|uniref:Glycosyltransferase involved in cell wall bisynthesis n=1 Tax=Tranquillimonas rosea TaxID=641238 RepID=A0A1H9TFE5_9RHOB|nr:glycosyltransferase [Tranquillimonas rosea]SER95955.1 Glycosyltransferase involved in cell wall bisynthesis [Tranquillimonas rosea]
MRILFAGGNGWLPEASGGTQNSTDHLIRQAMEDGHDCAVYCGFSGRGVFGFRMKVQRKLTGRPFSVDHGLGYEVMRTWEPMDPARVRAAVERFKPDVVVVQTRRSAVLGHEFAKLGIPVVLYLRNVEFAENDGDVSAIEGARFIANSSFTADTYKAEYGIDCTVITPTIDFDAYRYDTTREFVTLVNIHPKKGYEIARDMARACPDIPFLFVEAWTLWDQLFDEIMAELQELPNVTFMRRTSDMSKVYGRTGILLAPSQWEEAWGRVASEAHCSGIPVIGSDRGGLPQAIGPGGIVLPHDAPIDDWVAALRKLWSDEAAYEEMSRKAVDYAKRPELDFKSQYRTFISVLDAARSPQADPSPRATA